MEGERDLTTPTGRAKTVAIGFYAPVICNEISDCVVLHMYVPIMKYHIAGNFCGCKLLRKCHYSLQKIFSLFLFLRQNPAQCSTNWAVKNFSRFYFCGSWLIRENCKSFHRAKVSHYMVALVIKMWNGTFVEVGARACLLFSTITTYPSVTISLYY